MTVPRRRAIALAGLATAGLVLAGCGTEQPAEDGGGITVVASTNTWGSVAEAVGGQRVQVESIINDPASDPHSYESSPRDAAKVSDADLVVFNGGGYDGFMEQILSTAAEGKPVVEAVAGTGAEGAHDHAHDHEGHGAEQHAHEDHGAEHPAQEHEPEQGHDEHAEPEQGHDEQGHDHAGHEHANEHVWYDLHVMHEVARRIAVELAALDPAHAGEYHRNAGAFSSEVGRLEGRVGALADAHRGREVLVTEPIAHYLVEAAGLRDITPQSFVNAVEAESDPSAAAVAEIQDAVNSGRAAALVYNPQTASPVTRNIRAAAEDKGIPVVEMTETLPEGQSYVPWMRAQITALDDALNRSR
ncbi:metal ABC transporter solute-binding protein, Zn/Mn family [Saccharopolyspora cebuensis]|uniref:Metal ABC transporter solute-binding protein, Zn/Mn family n=1 Tax=Saccharopolyspora cebuensis TaxID=418759 RepID=A0ABV4CKG1_9PSEU